MATALEMTATEATIEQTATSRVENSETLAQYKDLLISYDWENRDEHLNWVATAPEAELVAWAEDIRRDEQN